MGWRAWLTCRALILSCVVVAGLGATAAAVVAATPAARLTYARGDHIYVAAVDGAHPRDVGTVGYDTLIAPDGGSVVTIATEGAGSVIDVYPSTGGRATAIALSPSDGKPVLLRLAGFSPDSRYLAVIGIAGIQIIDLRSGEIAATLTGVGAGSWSPTLPDRFAAAGNGNGGYGPGTPLSIWSASTDSLRMEGSGIDNPVWGRRRIAVEHLGQVWTMNPNGTDFERVTRFRTVGIGPTGQFDGIEPLLWSPNGRALLASYLGGSLPHDCVLSLRTGGCPAIVVRKDYAYPVAFNATGTGFLVSFGTADYAPRGLADRVATINLSGSEVHTLIPDAGQPSWTF